MSRTLLLALLGAAPLTAADPPAPPKTLMTESGKLLFRDDLGTVPGKEWRVGKGKWEPADGGLRGSELKADMHGAVMRHAIPFRSAVIQYSFKLDGARQTTLSINAAKGHLCRVVINKDGFTVRKDDSDHAGPDTAVVLEAKKTPIAPAPGTQSWSSCTARRWSPRWTASRRPSGPTTPWTRTRRTSG
jgi:hypothetical protein